LLGICWRAVSIIGYCRRKLAEIRPSSRSAAAARRKKGRRDLGQRRSEVLCLACCPLAADTYTKMTKQKAVIVKQFSMENPVSGEGETGVELRKGGYSRDSSLFLSWDAF
jgi:hypothetical protein